MPEIRRYKVVVEVEFEFHGVDSAGSYVDQAVKPIEDIKGARVITARAERQ